MPTLILSLSLLAVQITLSYSLTNTAVYLPNAEDSSALQGTQTPVSTSSPDGQSTGTPARTAPPLWLTLTLLAMCCAFLILIGVVILGFVVRGQNRDTGVEERKG